MNGNSLSEDYLRWLAPQIREDGDHREYWDLLTLMYEKEFIDLIPNDDNRIADGLDIRMEFFQRRSVADELGPCSFLEVLIGLSRRLSFNAGGSAEHWAWTLIENLKLDQMSDPLSNNRMWRADDILAKCIRREYKRNGHGGFFPLMHAREDQTKVELWYQMAAYIDELNPEF